jgi:hypothetical protein
VKIFRAMGRIIFPIRNVKRALGLSELKQSIENTRGAAKEIFQPRKKQIIKETFEQALVRLQLTEPMLKQRRKSLIITIVVYAALAVGFLVYAFYLLFTGLLLGAFISFVLTFTAVGFVFRDHFWYVQITCRRLGMSFKDWANYTLGNIKK